MQESELEAYVQKELIKAGWREQDILTEVYLNHNGRRLRPDMILLYNLYPLAVLEAKSQARDFENATLQGLLYVEALPEIPFVITTNGRKSTVTKTIDRTVVEIPSLPTPKDLWLSLNREWEEQDPRIFPSLQNSNYPVRLHQARAVSICLDNIVKGKKRNLVVMVTGSGRTLTITQLLWKLIRSEYYTKALLLTDRWELANQIHLVLQDAFQQDVQTFRQLSDLHHPRKLDVSVIHTFFDQTGALKPLDISRDFYDLIIVDDIKRVDLFQPLLAYFEDAVVVGFTSSSTHVKSITAILGAPIFTYDLDDALSSERFEPPPGYVSTSLEDIADISVGLMHYKKEEEKEVRFEPYPDDYFYLLSAREINENGTINLSTARRKDPSLVQLSKTVRRYGLKPNDIVVNSYFLGQGRIKIGFVSDSVPEKTIITSSLIRVRVNPSFADPKDVYEFLVSDTGQKVLQMYARGSASPRLTVRYLSQVPVFLSIDDSILSGQEDLSAASRAIDELHNKVLPLLKTIVDQPGIEEDEKLHEAQQRLHRIASSLLPPLLSERIVKDYPMPIALPYQQFKNAKFNVYEQVQRLKDTFEAISFFVYNLLLADYLRNLDPVKYFIEDAQARRAYKGYSLAYRLGFIEAVQEIAKFNKGQDLFIPEVLGFDTGKARILQDDLRNEAAHTATAPEQAQRKVIEKFEPLVEEMLAELEFLTNYRLVRVPLFYFNKGQFIRRMEIYRGVAPVIEETPIEEKGLLRADRENLVLVNDEEQILDLYPLYQLIASERSNYQRHVAFFKQRKFQERKLQGESLQGAYVIDLKGFEDFENLVARILDVN